MVTVDPPAPAAGRLETAAEHLTARVPVAAPTATVGEIRRTLEGQQFDTVAAIAICDEGKLVGLLRIEALLAAPADALASAHMDADPPVVVPGADQELVARKAVLHRESSLAVVDGAGRFVGLIPPHRLLAVLLLEHHQDLARLGGFLHDSAAARTAAQEPIIRRLWHRVPWLLVGLLGAILSADLVGAFEHQLRERVILAFFIPGVVYLADAVGTQTEALIIRGLSIGVAIRQVVWRELLTGLLVGVLLAGTFFPIAWWRWGEADVALAVALALLAACSIATLVAMLLPWLFQRFGSDPAFGSGPLSTVLQDLLSILIYFVICVHLVQRGG
jgi:magnesium transporter